MYQVILLVYTMLRLYTSASWLRVDAIYSARAAKGDHCTPVQAGIQPQHLLVSADFFKSAMLMLVGMDPSSGAKLKL
jgi:hypothetical protein